MCKKLEITKFYIWFSSYSGLILLMSWNIAYNLPLYVILYILAFLYTSILKTKKNAKSSNWQIYNDLVLTARL